MKFYRYPEISMRVRGSRLSLQRLLHIATDRTLPCAQRAITLAYNYEKINIPKGPTVVVPILFYSGDVPVEVYHYIMQTQVAAGRYNTGYSFFLPAIANENAIFMAPQTLDGWGIPRAVAGRMIVEDIRRAKNSLEQQISTFESIAVPETDVPPKRNILQNLFLRLTISQKAAVSIKIARSNKIKE